ncbi:hypothetical protein CDAR_490281 [Caerostris darwini]|uniref:Uncharacterized protein n=1 Tax=Caerostris darwini TaxID=1538125 RepID=A0AAV4R4H1_9ARAC|nr:hypothetical protein CDAR_490281 [Caerostris darwini]
MHFNGHSENVVLLPESYLSYISILINFPAQLQSEESSYNSVSGKKARAQSLIKVERDVDFGRFCNPIYVYNASNQRARRRAVQRSKFKQPFPVNLQGSTGYSFSKFMQNFCAVIYNCSSGV